MPSHVLVFYMLLASALTTAAWLGGRPERQVASMLLAAAISSKLVASTLHGHFAHFEIALFVIDLSLLAGLLAVATRSDRYWPLWLTPLHGYTVVAHLGRIVVPETYASVYLLNTALMADPGLVLLMIGSVRHCRRTGRCRPRRVAT